MKITLCGSIAFIKEMVEVQKELEELGHEVQLPALEVKGKDGEIISALEAYNIRKSSMDDHSSWIWKVKQKAMMLHYSKVAWCDAILVLNYEKNDIKGYIGGNTLMEMGIAQFLGKGIYLYDEIPNMSHTEEILGCTPILLNKELKNI